jgi:hypothetical protein
VPKTYLPVAVTLLLAKAIYGDEVDVTLLQAKAGESGFSASSIASILVGFAKGRDIDLRATSQSPFNNHPFTFVARLHDVTPGDQHLPAFLSLLETAKAINAMASSDAKRALAATLVLTRRVETVARAVALDGGRETFLAVCADLAEFAASHSDGGRVGQALCAALLDQIHGDVLLGVVNDPDARLPGDVHAIEDGLPWLWCEVKQKVIVTGDVVSFLRKVAAARGQRCLYLALNNGAGSPGLDIQQAQQAATDLGVDLVIVRSPEEAIALLTQFAPGEQGRLAARLLTQMRARLIESNSNPDVLGAFDDLVRRHGTLIRARNRRA